MNYLQYQQSIYHPAFTHQNPPQYAQDQYHYLEHQHRAQLYMPRRSVSLDGVRQAMAMQAEKNETKARLAKDQVEILEAKFQENNKPNSQTKRLLAQDFGVEQARINNWFQNRRAKAKQERKQVEHDAQKGSEVPYHDDDSASPDPFDNDVYDEAYHSVALGDMTELPILNGPPPAPVASFNPRYDNASAASMHSLARTLTAAQDALVRGDFSDEFEAQTEVPAFHDSRAPFPITTQGDFAAPMMPTDSSIAINTQQVLASQANNPYFGMNIHSSGIVSSPDQPFPSQLVEGRMGNGFQPHHFQSHAMMPINGTHPASVFSSPEAIEASFALNAIPGPSNIASRRAKQRPANLGVDALRSHLMGPRSYSSSDIPNRLIPQSPAGSPMRRVQSNQVGMNVISGRVQKNNNLPLRSPMTKGFNLNCENYMREMPQTAGANQNREFPPTPSSPFESNVVLHSQSNSSSPLDNSTNYIFQGGNFEAAENGSTMASPPETPHNPIVNNHWNFETMDQPLQTPQFEIFPHEMHLQMPPFVSPVSASQPNTPAFPTFTGFPMHDQYDQGQLEYIFPGDNVSYAHTMSAKSSPMSLQKTFTFNNVTQESLKNQQRRTEEREKTPVLKSVRM